MRISALVWFAAVDVLTWFLVCSNWVISCISFSLLLFFMFVFVNLRYQNVCWHKTYSILYKHKNIFHNFVILFNRKIYTRYFSGTAQTPGIFFLKRKKRLIVCVFCFELRFDRSMGTVGIYWIFNAIPFELSSHLLWWFCVAHFALDLSGFILEEYNGRSLTITLLFQSGAFKFVGVTFVANIFAPLITSFFVIHAAFYLISILSPIWFLARYALDRYPNCKLNICYHRQKKVSFYWHDSQIKK